MNVAHYYVVGYYTPQGRRETTVDAYSREEARTIALSRGLTVVDVSLDEDEEDIESISGRYDLDGNER